MKYILAFLCFALLAIPCNAQDNDSIPPLVIDTLQENVSIEEIEMYASQFIPRRASLYAAIFPGAGQIYNKKYWKLPLVYGRFVLLMS